MNSSSLKLRSKNNVVILGIGESKNEHETKKFVEEVCSVEVFGT